MLNKPRRTLLKGLAYGSALSVGGLSGLAVAKSNGQTSGVGATGDIHLLPTQHSETKTLSLFNHSDTDVIIGGIDQLNLDGEKSFLAIKVNASGQDNVTLAPGESREFSVTHNGAVPSARDGKLKVSAYHQAVNDFMPVTVFDLQAA